MPKVKPKLSTCQVDLLKTLLKYGTLTIKQLATKAKRDFTGTQWDVGRVCDRGKGDRTLETSNTLTTNLRMSKVEMFYLSR